MALKNKFQVSSSILKKATENASCDEKKHERVINKVNE